MKLTREQVIQLIQNKGPDGARAKLEAERGRRAEDYHIIAGQWEAGAPIGASTVENWTVIAVLKASVEINPADGMCRTTGGALVLTEGERFNTTHSNAHQMDTEDGRVWYWDMD